ncbi:MAG: transglutaminase [Acidobacteria bacterium]|nr:MAG: transglutaminase [Acidobacteriota bacterium]
MHHSRIWIGLIALACAASNAADKEVQYAAPPSWVLPVPTPTDAKTPDGASYRVVYSDNQIHFGSNGIEAFQAYRLKILRADALAAGNITLTWNPDGGDARVHYVRIIRDKETIDVLKTMKFQVLQREGFLEKAALNGELTAVLQVPGLQIDDELEMAATIRRKDPTLGDHLFGFAQLAPTGQPGAFRIRMIMPAAASMHWRASPDVTGLSPKTASGQTELLYELRDPHAAVLADGAPARINVRRLIEVSDFDSWADVSRRIWPLFEKASALSPESPVRKEIARIASANSDPTKRIEAALQLVQDRIRYVYIGFNGGELMPATADETWERRFGDCKAKTALLLAILRELGIRGEAVLVNSLGGDGINERLPTPAMFDHVVVRVALGDKTYWLDGSRLGDQRMDPSRQLRWALPVRRDGADLERLPSSPPKSPDSIGIIDVDATKGFDQKAGIKVQQVLHGDAALEIRSKLVVLSAEDADRALRAFWQQSDAWIEPDAVSWRYDEQRTTVILTLTGRGKLDWTGSDAEGRSLTIFGAGFTPPAEHHRPKEQDQTAPWVTRYPSFRCWATAIHLPDGGSKWKWDYASDPIDTHLGGVDYWRLADLRDGVIRTVMSSRSDVPEITADQAEEVNKGLPTFNNKMSSVFQVALNDRGSDHKRLSVAPFQVDTDWTSPDTPCVPQSQVSWVFTFAPIAAVSSAAPAIRSLGGVTLGITASQLIHARGAPAQKIASNHWIYNSIDAAHDGLLDVLFSEDAAEESREVRMVIFSGKRGAEPAGMAKLLGRTRQSLVRQYGEPVSEAAAGPHGKYLYFQNGVAVLVVSDATMSYGIYDVTKWSAK